MPWTASASLSCPTTAPSPRAGDLSKVAQLKHLWQAPRRAYHAYVNENEMEGTMRNLVDVVATIALGAAVLLGVSLTISFTPSALELIALRH